MFGIFDLPFTKDPTIFVRESFIFAGNSLAHRAGVFFFVHNSFARRRQFSRASRGRVHRSRQQSQVRPCSPARWKKAARGGKKRVAHGEDTSREKLSRHGEYGYDKEFKILGISKLSSHCAYAKIPSLVHQMPSLPKCISQMQNCWRAIFKIFSKFQKCKVQLHNCWRCSNKSLSTITQMSSGIEKKRISSPSGDNPI